MMSRFKIGLCILLMMGFLPELSWAGEGTTGAEFLYIAPGARSAALGGCYAALGNDAETLFYNPAGILDLFNPQIGLSHITWWDGVTYDAFWGVQPLGEKGTLGLSGTFLNILPFNSTDDPAIGSEQAWSMIVGGAYAKKIQRNLGVGLQIKYLSAKLGTAQSWGAAVDGGLKYFLSNDQLVIAAAFQQAGFMNAFKETQDPLPTQFNLETVYHLWPDEPQRLSLTGGVSFPLRGRLSLAGGIEGWVGNIFALRVGFKNNSDAGDWLICGSGVHWQSFHVDYALSPLGIMGLVHRFSLSYDFGSQRHLARPKLKVIMLTKHFVYTDGEAGYEIRFIPTAQVAAGLQNWEVVIVNRPGQEVRRIEGKGKLPISVVWDGLDRQGKRVNIEGYYVYQFAIKDNLGYTSEATGEILPISIMQLPQLKALPRDIFAGKVGFAPATGAGAKEWTIDVMNAEGRILKQYQGVGMIPKDFAWDGMDQSNRPVAVKEGFHFVVRTKDKSGNEVKSEAPLLVVDSGTKIYSQAPVNIPEPVPFRLKYSSGIKFKGWSLDIINTRSKEIIRSYHGLGTLPEPLVWDSRDEQKRVVASDQQYSYILRLQDPMGNIWSQAAPLQITEVKVLSQTPGEMKVKIEKILFDFNQAELKPEMFEKIHKSADLVKLYPKTRMSIEGHTDEIGTEAYNYELSVKRAKMVMRYLVEEEGLASNIIEIRGFGKNQPLGKGTDPQSQSQNRRVEIVLYLSP